MPHAPCAESVTGFVQVLHPANQKPGTFLARSMEALSKIVKSAGFAGNCDLWSDLLCILALA